VADPTIPNLLLGPQRIGSDRTYQFGPLLNASGVKLVNLITIVGNEPISFTIWAGDGGSALATITGSWASTADGIVEVTVLASAITSFDPGRYRISGTVVINTKTISFIPDDFAYIDIADAAGAPSTSATFTRAKVERVLIRRCGRLMSFARLDGKTDVGSNSDLSDPISLALRDVGVTAFDPVEPSDADIASVTESDRSRFLDIAELRCLESVQNNIDEVSEKQGTDNQEWNTWFETLRKRIADKRKALQDVYGFGMGSLKAATLFRIAYLEPEPGSIDDDDEAEQ
jgi:hypothetical protein